MDLYIPHNDIRYKGRFANAWESWDEGSGK